MAVRWETIKVDGNDMRVYLGVPERAGPHPGVVIAQHGPGVDAQIQDAVHRLHREGYVVAAPELSHRTSSRRWARGRAPSNAAPASSAP
jgi:dienelactone hydrolase